MEIKQVSLAKKIVYCIAFIALFYNSNTFWCSADTTIGVILSVVAIVAILLMQRNVSRKYLITVIMVGAFVLGNMLLTGTTEYIGMCIRFILVLVLAITIAKYIDFDIFKTVYVKTLVALTVIALVIYILVNLLGRTSILSMLPILTNVNGVKAYNGVLFCVYTYRYDRLMSIFWEPSIYATFASIAIIFVLFFDKEKHVMPIRAIVLAAGVIASKSTGGYLLLLLIALFYVMVAVNNVIIKKIMLIVGILIVGLSILYFDELIALLIKINPDVFYKLDFSIENTSLITRMNSGGVNLSIFYDNPIIGVGLGAVDSYYIARGGDVQSSTLTYYLAAFGVIGIIPTLTLVHSIFKQRHFYWIYKVFLLAVFLVMLLKEPYWFACGMYAIILQLVNNDVRHSRLELGGNK